MTQRQLLKEALEHLAAIKFYCVDREARGYTIPPVEFMPDDCSLIVRGATQWYEREVPDNLKPRNVG